METTSTITLLTDFGNQDGFIGVMKGVILQMAPQARLVDLSHDLPPFSISSAAFLNDWSYGYFPAGTVHLCVVDPGVGTRRRVLVVQAAGHYFVAPDNGLLTPLFDDEETRIFHATNPRYWLDKVSNTFHGRDVFSPLAAHLARGVAIEELGEPIGDPVRIELPQLKITEEGIECAISYIDRFGNLVTNLAKDEFDRWCGANGCGEPEVTIRTYDRTIQGISRAYGDRKKGELLAVFDGFDRLEISISGGNAALTTGMGIGDRIYIRRTP